MHRGKIVILLMVLIGCAMGGISVAFHHWLARRTIAWWGRDNVELITEAPRVDALRLAPATESDQGETLAIGALRYRVVERKNVTGVMGLNHLRNSLLEDAHFHWDEPRATNLIPKWAFALEFIAMPRRLTVLFDRDGHVGRSDTAQILSITPIATGWSEFFAEQEVAGGNRESAARGPASH
jgi:hypothetical protein